MCRIDEFSTAIKVQAIDERWISKGFISGWMHTTCQVPDAVERAIRNGDFEVTLPGEGYACTPSIVGRIITGVHSQNYSVIALASYGSDDFARDVSLYRYFLYESERNYNEEINGLDVILGWMQKYYNEKGKLPIFDPLRVQQPQAHICSEAHSTQHLGTDKKSQKINDTNIILPPEMVESGVIGYLTKINKLAKTDNCGSDFFSWAYNVQSLNCPSKFTIICAANEQAFEHLIIQGQNNSIPLPPNTDLKLIESAIRRIKDGKDSIGANHMSILLSTMRDEMLNDEHWVQIFDDNLQAKEALNNKLFLPDTIRLLTLRAIVIPRTLPIYLDWLKIVRVPLEITRRNKWHSKINKDALGVSLKFQKQVKPYYNHEELKKRISEGLKIALKDLLNYRSKKNDKIPSLCWLLSSKEGAWTPAWESVRNDIFHDLNKLASDSDVQELKCEALWENLGNSHIQTRAKYESFAFLFQGLKEFRLSAYFWQVSTGEVPKKVLEKLKVDSTRDPDDTYEYKIVLGQKVIRKFNFIEKVFFKIAKFHSSISQFIFIAAITLFINSNLRFLIIILMLGFGLMRTVIHRPNSKVKNDFHDTNFPIKPLKAFRKIAISIIIAAVTVIVSNKVFSNSVKNSRFSYQQNGESTQLQSDFSQREAEIANPISAEEPSHLSSKKIPSSEAQIDHSLQNFEVVRDGMQNVIDDLILYVSPANVSEKDSEKIKAEVIEAVKMTLAKETTINSEDLTYAGVIQKDSTHSANVEIDEIFWQNQWVDAILEYRENFIKSNTNVFLRQDGEIFDHLKCDVARIMNADSSQDPIYCKP